MKNLPLLLFSSSVLLLTACSGFRVPRTPVLVPQSNQTGPNQLSLNPEGAAVAIKSEDVMGYWSFCQPQDGTSTEFVFYTVQEGVRIDANKYPVADCTGDIYETFSVGQYQINHDSELLTNAFYPNTQVNASGVMVFDEQPLAQATIKFTRTSVDRIQMTLTDIQTASLKDLQNYQEGPQQDDLPLSAFDQTITLDLKKVDHPKRNIYGKIKQTGLNASIGFPDEVAADHWLKTQTSTAIDATCVTTYLYGTPEDILGKFSPMVQSYFKAAPVHSDLIKSGFTFKKVSVAKVEDRSRREYLILQMTYTSPKEANAAPKSYMLCPIVNRAVGLTF